MSTINFDHLTLETAQVILRQFMGLDRLTLDSIPTHALTQQALLVVVHHSDYQIFGICADTAAEAAIGLRAYLQSLGYDEKPEVTLLEGPVYVKFNPKTGRCHTAPYTGSHRGVLVSCQSAYDGDVNETFGHLPIDLFS